MTIDARVDDATTFAGFRCWTPTWADETISIEAVTASPAVFLATHRPLLIARTPVTADEGTDRDAYEIVSEEEVLRDFVQRRPVNGVLIMPVVGQSGTGKSHLVRWIREHLDERSDRRVVYIEKTNTNLSGVVHALLMGLEGEEFDSIRAEVDKVVTDYDERRLPGELLAQLALSIEFSSIDETRPDARYRRALVGQGRLSALLLDNVMYSRLVAPGGVVARLAKELQRGRAHGEAERRFGFEIDDFPTDLVDIASAGASARRLMQQLVASEDLLTTAVQLLNENLDQAVLRLANLTGGKLQGAMLDIRRALQKNGQEIVLLVEDFAVIQGVQRDLLDAITEVGVREGREELAPIRTLMAVTRGYFNALAETVTTRAAAGIPYLYDLDVSIGESNAQVNSRHIHDFAARYLNAARLGRSALEDARTAAGQATGGEWVPNACDSCPFQEQCHEAFGRSSDGHGLYPFNDQALDRTVRSRSSSEVFNPRAVLGRVLRPVLESYYDDISEGRFPPPAFARDFPLSPRDRPLLAEVVQSLRLNDATDYERRAVLLGYWGGAPVEPGNLTEGIHHAFRLPRIEAFNVVAPPDTGGSDQGGEGPRPDLPVGLVRGRAALENWFGRQEVLPQEVARQLRGIISTSVLRRISWNDELLTEASKDELKVVLRDRYGTGVRIEGAAGEVGLQEAGAATIRIARSDVMATLLGALLMRDHLGHWNFPGGPAQARRFRSLADSWAARIVTGVREVRGADDHATTASAVSVSLTGGLALGIDGARSRDHADLVRALLDDGQSVTTLGDAEVRPREWSDLTARVLEKRPALIAQLRGVGGAAQGTTGHVQLIDVDRLLPYVRAWGDDSDLLALPATAPQWLSEAARPLRERLVLAVEAQWTMIEAWATEVLPSFENAAAAPAVLAAMERALEEAVSMGVYAGGRAGPAADQQEMLRAARKYAWSTLDEIRTALTRPADDPLVRLKEAAADRGRSLGPIQRLVRAGHTWLDGSLARAAARVQDEAPEGGLGLVDLLDGVAQAIQDLQRPAPQDTPGPRTVAGATAALAAPKHGTGERDAT